MSRRAADSVAIPVVRREARTLAAAIDFLVISLIGVACLGLALLAMLLQVNPLERDPTTGEWIVGYVIGLCWFLLSSWYAGLGAGTIGSRALRLRELRSGKRTFLVRSLVWWPSLLILGIGLWLPWVDPQGRSLPEMLTGSLLIEATPS